MVRLVRRAPGCPRAVLGPSQRRTALSADAVHSHSWKGGVRARDVSRSQRCSRPARSRAARPAQNVGSRMATILTQVTCEVGLACHQGLVPQLVHGSRAWPASPSEPAAGFMRDCRRAPSVSAASGAWWQGGRYPEPRRPPVDASAHRSLRPRVILEIEKTVTILTVFSWESLLDVLGDRSYERGPNCSTPSGKTRSPCP